MSAEEISLVSSQNGLNSHSHAHSQLLFQDDNLRFNCGGAQPSRHGVVGDSNKTTRELAAIIDDKLFSSNSSAAAVNTASSFPSTTHHHLHHQQGQTQPSPQDFRRNMYRRGPQETDESDSEEDDVDDDDEEDDDVDDDDMNGGGGYNRENSNRNGLKSNRSNNNGAGTSSCNANNTSTSAATITNRANLDKLGNGNGKSKDFPCFGSGEELMVVKDGVGCIGKIENNNEPGVTIAEPDGEIYYSQYLQATTEACGGSGSGRKEGSSFLSESGESLRAILSDPVTGALMDDAMILPCGHSFGTGGIHHVIRLKACYSCAQSISEDSITPNLSLRAAVQAFHREEELQFYRSPKRRRDRFDQDKGSFGDLTVMDHPRSRGVQFPFAVTDRVVIKGNKRTPQRFVGREAVVTTQCLNGWYVVKTLDNAESVKLQYRSLARVSNDPSSKANPSKTTPSWLQSS